MFALCISACTKWQKQYPEDSERTKETPTTRLTGKWWTLQSATLNGKDYTDSVYQMFGKYQIYFSKSILSTTNYLNTYSGNIKTGLEPAFTTRWRFENNEEDVYIGAENGNGGNGNNSSKVSIVPCYLSEMGYQFWEFKVLKLTNSQLKIGIHTSSNDSIITNNFISN